jgi:hypothetical protein
VDNLNNQIKAVAQVEETKASTANNQVMLRKYSKKL